MKRKLLIALSALGFGLATQAQNMRVNAYSSYVFDDKVDSYYSNTDYYNGVVKGGFQWGVGLEYMAQPSMGLELIYLRQDTKAPMTYYSSGVKTAELNLGINYIMLGGNRYFRKPGGIAEGFGGFMLGVEAVSIKNPTTGGSGSKTFFSWGVKGGVNIWAAQNVGIKLQAQLLSGVQSVGGGLYFGTGGAGAGFSANSSIYQFSLGGGLVFRLPGGATAKK